MSEIETNIFRILNLRELSSTYRMYEVLNLHEDQDEYYQNCQHITRKLSYQLRSPVVVIEENHKPVLIVKEGAPPPPKDMVVIRNHVEFKALPGQFTLDYSIRSPKNDAIAIRFLSFLLQTPLYSNPALWQPAAGQAFFERQPCDGRNSLDRYRGFSVRPILTPTGEIGLCVDVHSKLLFRRPLPLQMDRQMFQRFKGAHCIYHFGNDWYEIVLSDFSTFSASRHKFQVAGKNVVLYDYILEKCRKPLPPEISNLPKDSPVVLYSDKREQKLSAAAALCYRVVGNDDPIAQKEFPSLSIEPQERRKLIHAFVETHLKRLRFGNHELKVETKPLTTTPKLFQVPDFEFGCSTILSTRATPGSIQVSLDNLGLKRLSLLKDKSVGFYDASQLDNFYFIYPQSIHETFGPKFLESLSATVDDLFPQEKGFEPEPIFYSDRGCRNFEEISQSIFATVEAQCRKGAYAVVMIPEDSRRRKRQEDTSAAHVIQQLKERSDMRAAVIHTTLSSDSYGAIRERDGSTRYYAVQRAEKRLNGYFRGVAINKILLLNQKWPFVLASPLHADVVVGIDVKGHMAGFIATNKQGNIIVPYHKKSQQKEKLMPNQCKEYFCHVVTNVAARVSESIKNIVVHRDGRLYDTEIKGLRLGLQELKDQGLVDADAELTFVEIPQTSPALLRLFDISNTDYDGPDVQNPQVGNYFSLNLNEGFVCTTGRAFRRWGTTKPLHVVKKSGPLTIEQCMEDVFYLSCLAWTRPEDCSRDPITTKLNDRWLGEEGAEHKEETETENLPEETST